MNLDIYLGSFFIILGSIFLYLSSTKLFMDWWQKKWPTSKNNIKRNAKALIFAGLIYIFFGTMDNFLINN